MADTRDVFVSHIHEDEQHIENMKSLLAEHGFNVRDSSITSETPNRAKDPDYIRQILGRQIDWASVLVVLISPGMRHSQYVDFEIEYANKHDKRIVGVWTHGAADADVLPEALQKYADSVVAWRGEAIKEAICGERSGWETSDGAPRPPLAISRHGSEPSECGSTRMS